MKSMTSEDCVIIRTARQAECFLAAFEMNRRVLQHKVFGLKAKIGPRFAKICFEANNLKSARIDPGATLQGHWVDVAAHTVLPDAAFLVFPLAEANLPRESGTNAAQTLAGHVKIGNDPRMENQDDRGESRA